MRGKRVLSMVAAMLLLASMALAGLQPAPAAAQADELSQRDFDDLVEAVQEDDPVFGPEDGELELDPDIVTTFPAELELADFLATATFANPYAGSSTQFDYGIQFRGVTDGDEAVYLRFLVVSTTDWAVTDNASEILVQGSYDDLDVGRNGENELTVYAEAELVHLGINGDYVGSVEVDVEDPGDVAVGTSFFADSFEEGAVTEFTDFTIWEIGGGGRSTSGDDEPTPGVDDDSDDRGPLGPLGPRDDPTATDEDEPTAEPDDEPTRDTTDDEPTPEATDEPSRDDGQDDSGDATGDGTVYESPSYEFTFRYDDSIWEMSESSEDSLDLATLTSENSTLTLYGLPPQEDAAACADILLNGLLTTFEDNGFSGEVETVDSGDIEDGPLTGSAFTHAEFTVEAEDGDPLIVAIYVACGPHADGDYFIGVRHYVIDSSLYDDEVDLREDVIVTILAAGEEPARDDEEDPTAEPEEVEPTPEPDDEPTRDDQVEPAPAGARYESPSYGFSLSFDDSVWELSGESSDEGIDTASLSNGISTVTVYGLPNSSTPAECIEALLAVFIGSLEDADIVGEIEVTNEGQVANGPLEGSEFLEVLFVAESDDGEVALAIYVSCGALGGGDHYVGVRHFVLPDAYEGEAASRDDLLAGLSAEGEAPVETGNGDEPADNGGDEPSRDDDDNGSVDIDSPNVSRVDGAVIYTSPSYGFSVEIQPGFSVEQDTVANGYDTLVIANSQARITVAGFASSNSAASCVDSIIANLNADPSFSNVTLPVDEAGAPIRIDEDGISAVPVYLTYTENGEQVTVGRLYACFSFTGVNGGSATLVYAYETPADIFIDEFDNIVAMLDLIAVP